MSISRNVVILGKVGSGKKTLGNHIAGRDIFQRESVLGTGNVCSHYGEYERGGTLYRILTVDTESLQTGYNDPMPHIQQRFQTIHLIIFTIPYGRYTDESHGSLVHAVGSLHQRAKSVSALVITHCEGMTDKRRQGIIAEFRDNARSSHIVAFMQRGTHVVGFPDTSTLHPNVKSILQNRIKTDEEAIRQLVDRCESELSVKDLPGLRTQHLYHRPSAAAAIKRQATSNKPRQWPYYSEGRTEYPLGPTSPKSKTCVQIGAGVSQPKALGQDISRNVVILGKVGSGKKTLGNRIAGSDIVFQRESALDTGIICSYYGEYERGSTLYRILTVDTESEHTGYNDPMPHIQQRFEKIHLIIFTIPFGRHTDESHGSLVQAVGSLHQEAKSVSALVITHCEEMTDKQRQGATTEFRDNARSSQVVPFMQYGIYADEEAIRKLVEQCKCELSIKHLLGPRSQQPYHSPSAATATKRQAIDKNLHHPLYTYNAAEHTVTPDYPLTDQGPTDPKPTTHVQLGVSQPKTPGQIISRNVVILGKVGAGKKSLGNHIAGKSIFQRESALGTGNVGFHYGECTTKGTTYRILTVDTESLQTGYNDPMSQILRFQTIHLIMFTIPYGRYTDESHGSLVHAVGSLHQRAKSVSALVITHCEGMTDKRRQGIIAEFRDNARSSHIVAFMKRGTHAVGFPDISTLHPNVKAIVQNGIDTDEKAIRNLVDQCDSEVSVNDLPAQYVQQHYTRPQATVPRWPTCTLF